MSLPLVLVSVCLLTVLAAAADRFRLSIFDCGRNIGRDQARWSPGVSEGTPIEFSNNGNHDRAQSASLRYAPAYYD